jgi:Trypsin-like peptidase domain
MKTFAYVVLLIIGFQTQCVLAQDNKTLPISTQTLLSGVTRVESRGAIKSVLKIVCPKDQRKGTGFVISAGNIITTASHVVGTCAPEELVGTSSVTTEPVRFTAMRTDSNRDLAILCTSKPLPFSLFLNDGKNPDVDTEVETWGYPLSDNDPAPLLSRGYVAGYGTNVRQAGATPVKRLIVNGAFNPGNSGGPLIDRATGKVIGIVVEKWTLWSPQIQAAIHGFANSSGNSYGTFSYVNEQGQRVPVSDQKVLSDVLDEFYKTSQVMIGEAISVSELNAFLKEKQKELPCGSH